MTIVMIVQLKCPWHTASSMRLKKERRKGPMLQAVHVINAIFNIFTSKIAIPMTMKSMRGRVANIRNVN
jgi:hypothetical protein